MRATATDTFVTDDGALVRYSDGKTIRPVYARTFQRIRDSLELRATIRAGGYAWPGGYPITLITRDGDALCFDCARKEYYQLAYSLRHKLRDGWNVVGCDVVMEGDVTCCHCNKTIAGAYSETPEESHTVLFDGRMIALDAARMLMDDELCEAIHGAVSTDQEFFDAYLLAHHAKYGISFSLT